MRKCWLLMQLQLYSVKLPSKGLSEEKADLQALFDFCDYRSAWCACNKDGEKREHFMFCCDKERIGVRWVILLYSFSFQGRISSQKAFNFLSSSRVILSLLQSFSCKDKISNHRPFEWGVLICRCLKESCDLCTFPLSFHLLPYGLTHIVKWKIE